MSRWNISVSFDLTFVDGHPIAYPLLIRTDLINKEQFGFSRCDRLFISNFEKRSKGHELQVRIWTVIPVAMKLFTFVNKDENRRKWKKLHASMQNLTNNSLQSREKRIAVVRFNRRLFDFDIFDARKRHWLKWNWFHLPKQSYVDSIKMEMVEGDGDVSKSLKNIWGNKQRPNDILKEVIIHVINANLLCTS